MEHQGSQVDLFAEESIVPETPPSSPPPPRWPIRPTRQALEAMQEEDGDHWELDEGAVAVSAIERFEVVAVDEYFGYITSQGDFWAKVIQDRYFKPKRRRTDIPEIAFANCQVEDYYGQGRIFQNLDPETILYMDIQSPDAAFDTKDYLKPVLGTLDGHGWPTQYVAMHIPWGGYERSNYLWRLILYHYSHYIKYSYMLGTFIRGDLEFYIFFWLPPSQPKQVHWTTQEFEWLFDELQDQGEHSDVEFEGLTELTFWWQLMHADAPFRYMP